MHFVMVVTTKNSIYTITRLADASAPVKIHCNVGTLQGQTFEQTRAQFWASELTVGEPGKILTDKGPIHTSKVQDVQEFSVQTFQERVNDARGVVHYPADRVVAVHTDPKRFVQDVVDHIMGPQVIIAPQGDPVCPE